MTISAPSTGPRPELPALVIERLHRIQPYAVGLTDTEAHDLAEQAFRNFPGVDINHLVLALTTATVGE